MLIYLELTNEYGIIKLGDSSDYKLKNLEITEVAANLITESSYGQDGASLVNTLLGVRDITFELIIKVPITSDVNTYRREVVKNFNPKVSSTLKFVFESESRIIDVTPAASPKFSTTLQDNKATNFQRCFIHLKALDPWFKDVDETQDELSDNTGGLEFAPLELPTYFATRGQTETLTNNGDVETHVVIEINAPAQNPEVNNNTTGEDIIINKTISGDEQIIISTEDGNKYVVDEDGDSIYSDLDVASTLWKLQKGENEIQFTTEGGYSPTVYIYYRQRWLSI